MLPVYHYCHIHYLHKLTKIIEKIGENEGFFSLHFLKMRIIFAHFEVKKSHFDKIREQNLSFSHVFSQCTHHIMDIIWKYLKYIKPHFINETIRVQADLST